MNINDWNQEQIDQYFDTTELLKIMNGYSQKEEDPIIQIVTSESDEDLYRRDERGHRIPTVQSRLLRK
jgi:hypothetical protein